jgi:hypothetical protein
VARYPEQRVEGGDDNEVVISLRPARPADYDFLYRLLMDDWYCSRRFGSGQSLAQYSATLSSVALHNVIECDGQLSGQVFCYGQHAYDRYAYLGLDIAPALRGRGIGRAVSAQFVPSALRKMVVRKLYVHRAVPSDRPAPTMDTPVPVRSGGKVAFYFQHEALIPGSELWDDVLHDLQIGAAYPR